LLYHTALCGNSSVGRAQPCQGWGREFESRFPLQIFFSVSFSKNCSIRGNSSVGRAQPCQGWGREFESRFPLQIQKSPHRKMGAFLLDFLGGVLKSMLTLNEAIIDVKEG
jgi:hypothetical protein